MRIKIVTYLFCMLLLFSSDSMFAKKKKHPPEPPQYQGPVPPGLSIDGGISFLLIAGTVFGVYAIKKRLKNSKN
jgi:hypothetical protein